MIGSVYVNSFRCVVRAFVYYFDKSDNYLGESATIEVNQPSLTAPTLAQLPRLSAVMPSGVASVATARIAFEMVATGTQSNPFAWFVMPMLEKVAEGKSTPSPWVDGAGGLATATFAMKAAQDAQITIATDVNGLVSGMFSANDGTRSSFSFLATVFRVISSASSGLEWQNGYLRAYSSAIQLVLGINFGSASNLCFWYGPNVGATNCTKSNGTIWFDNTGGAYFGGSLSAGTKKNAVQTTTTVTVGTELVNGPFNTNGGTRAVTISFSRQMAYVSNASGSGGFSVGSGSNTAVVQVYRRIGSAAESLWQTLNVGGAVDIVNEPDAPDRVTATWGGATTVNDTSAASDLVTYRAVITGYTAQSVTHPGTINSITTTQNLSIISVEN